MDILKKLDMAEYSSSDDMIRALSHSIDDMCFKKRLSSALGGTAVIDGFADRPDRYVFVEAKLKEPYHKPYGHNSPCVVSQACGELYEYINENMGDALLCDMKSDEKGIAVTYFCNGHLIEYFDLGRLICHLTAIATGLLEGTLEQKQIDILYLLYDPTELDTDAQIEQIYSRVCDEVMQVDINSLFVVILSYLRYQKGVGDMPEESINRYLFDLTFALCNQDFYLSLI